MNFDLNIGNYQKKELEDLFDLPDGFNKELLDAKHVKLKKNIMSNKQIAIDLKPQIIDFLETAKKIIVDGFSKVEHVGENIKSLQTTYESVYNVDKTLKPSDTVADGGTFLIQKPHTPYGQSKPSEFYEGVINPLNNRILRKNLNIDTRFRDNYYSTTSANFHVDLPIRFTKIVSMQLSALEIPTTFYAISKVFGNNFFVITIQGVDQVITIPDGNYKNKDLQNLLNALMADYASNPDPNISLLQYILFSADNQDVIGTSNGSGSGRMIVSVSSTYNGTEPIVFGLKFNTDRIGNDDRNTPLPLKLGWMFGFREGIYIDNVNYVSEGLIDLLGPRYLYLVVDDFNNNVNDGFFAAFNSSILNKNILARISLQGSVFNYLSQNNLSLITYARQYFGPIDIQKLQIQLLDEYGRIIDLNNMDYSFCLTLQTIYDL
jgi:hypothetical protein